MWDEIHQEGFMGLGKEIDGMGAQRLSYLPIFYIATTSYDFISGNGVIPSPQPKVLLTITHGNQILV
jgi:hypothetical protein